MTGEGLTTGEKIAVIYDRTERMEQMLLGDAVQGSGLLARVQHLETKTEAKDRTAVKAGGVGAAMSSLFTAVVAFILAKLGVPL